MTILHMDVDACTSTMNTLASTRDQIQQNVSGLTANITHMVGNTWVAPDANIFLGNFQDWQTKLNASLDNLKQLGTVLDTEIKEWEAVAANS